MKGMTINQQLELLGVLTIRMPEGIFLSYNGSTIKRYNASQTIREIKEKWGLSIV